MSLSLEIEIEFEFCLPSLALLYYAIGKPPNEPPNILLSVCLFLSKLCNLIWDAALRCKATQDERTNCMFLI